MIANPHFAVAGFVACGIKPINRHAVDNLIIGNQTNTSSRCERPIGRRHRKEVIKCLQTWLNKYILGLRCVRYIK